MVNERVQRRKNTFVSRKQPTCQRKRQQQRRVRNVYTRLRLLINRPLRTSCLCWEKLTRLNVAHMKYPPKHPPKTFRKQMASQHLRPQDADADEDDGEGADAGYGDEGSEAKVHTACSMLHCWGAASCTLAFLYFSFFSPIFFETTTTTTTEDLTVLVGNTWVLVGGWFCQLQLSNGGLLPSLLALVNKTS